MSHTPNAASQGAELPRTVPTPASTTIAEFDTYEEAQMLVDRLSDQKFPVEHVRIIGTGLTSVEQVLGRTSYGRAALYGALGGAWFGLFVGLLFGLITLSPWTWLFWAVLIGAGFGLLFGVLGQAFSGGRRDFESVRTIDAARYGVQVDSTHANAAVQAMSRPVER